MVMVAKEAILLESDKWRGTKISLPIEKKNVAHGLEKLRATSQKNTGNVFQNYEQCFLKLWAILFTATGNENSMFQRL